MSAVHSSVVQAPYQRISAQPSFAGAQQELPFHLVHMFLALCPKCALYGSPEAIMRCNAAATLKKKQSPPPPASITRIVQEGPKHLCIAVCSLSFVGISPLGFFWGGLSACVSTGSHALLFLLSFCSSSASRLAPLCFRFKAFLAF